MGIDKLGLVWTRPARADRREIFEFIAVDSPRAARKMDLIFAEKADLLTKFPEIGRPGRVPGTRELLAHRHYFPIYRIRGVEAQILRLLHSSRQWPPIAPARR
jgi:addiction module RelE/StbE family toxin